MPIHEARLWLQLAIQIFLLISSGLLFAFSRMKQDGGLQILLSLDGLLVIQREYIYRCTVLLVRSGFDGFL